MTRQSSTLPSTAEQAHHALLLLGAPAPARLVVDVHAALFDGDLAVTSLAALLRAEQRTSAPESPGGTAVAAGPGHAYTLCLGLNLDLGPARGLLALASWPLERRIVSPAAARADALAMIVRVAEFVAVRPVGGPALRLLRQLAERVPGGPEAVDVLNPGALAQVARRALADAGLRAAVDGEQSARAAAVARAGQLDRAHQLFGLPALPHQRGPE